MLSQRGCAVCSGDSSPRRTSARASHVSIMFFSMQLRFALVILALSSQLIYASVTVSHWQDVHVEEGTANASWRGMFETCLWLTQTVIFSRESTHADAWGHSQLRLFLLERWILCRVRIWRKFPRLLSKKETQTITSLADSLLLKVLRCRLYL